MRSEQTADRDLFGSPPVPEKILREERFYGKMDAVTGLSLRNFYSSQLSGERLAAYEAAFHERRRGRTQE